MHRVSGRHQEKKKKKEKGNNNICHVDCLDITKSCLLEREDTLCVVAEDP